MRTLSATDVYICIRRTLDWQDASLVRKHILPEFLPKLQAWNATFDLPYHRFRFRLTEIARRSLAGVEGATCVPLGRAPLEGLIVPVDDDCSLPIWHSGCGPASIPKRAATSGAAR